MVDKWQIPQWSKWRERLTCKLALILGRRNPGVDVAMEASYRSHLTFILGHLKDFQNFISQ
jgi:hypothetical protein